MHELWQRLKRVWGQPTERHSRRQRIGFTALESRKLMAIVPLSAKALPITAIFSPKILPNNGNLIPVTVTGKVTQGLTAVIAGNPTVAPPASSMSFIQANLIKRAQTSPLNLTVTDQYRQYEPRVSTPLNLVPSDPFNRHTPSLNNFIFTPSVFNPITKTYSPASEQLFRAYTYTATVYLQAKANSGTHGRRYTISVSTSDSDNGADVNFAVVVPGKK